MNLCLFTSKFCQSVRTILPKSKKLLRNFENSEGQFLGNFENSVVKQVSYKKKGVVAFIHQENHFAISVTFA